MNPLALKQITIVGTGLIGGSIGLALRKQRFSGRIIGLGRRTQTLDKAVAAGCIDEGTTDPHIALAGADLIMLATPVLTIGPMLQRIADWLKGQERSSGPGPMVTDAASTKGSIVEAGDRLLEGLGRFVGAHPMAGSDENGPEAAQADLFIGKPVILTPSDRTDGKALELIEAFWKQLGMRTRRMAPAEHDRIVATISHLPHAVAGMLVRLAREDGALHAASTGFGDTTRIAGSDPALWVDIFLDNRLAVLEALKGLTGRMEEFSQALQSKDGQAIQRLLAEAREARLGWAKGEAGR